MDTTVLKCPGCNSPLPYNAEKKLWKCEYCGSEFNREQILELTKQKSDTDTDIKKPEYKEELETPDPEQPELNLYRCQNCGAEMVADQNTSSTFCVYCGSTGILKSRLEGKFRPKYIIPFSKTKEDAIAAYNGLRKGRFLAPKEFGEKENIEKITGVYIPFWLYDGFSQGLVEGERHDKTSWRSGDYIYTKTDVYYELRAGSEAFEKVPADGSEKFDDDLMDSIEPFKLEELEPFNYSYLSGFLSEKYDVGAEKDQERASLRMNNSLKQSLYSTINGSLISPTEKINCTIEKVEYALLPVWMLNTFVNGKAHTFAMNGQTGKIIGDIPVDPKKSILYLLFLTALGFGIGALIDYIFF
ncbi:MAG: hypothetical protein IIU11_08860 [Bacteroidales bacterium]|nr:hypothetical protein [Bacteroidales bacterium]